MTWMSHAASLSLLLLSFTSTLFAQANHAPTGTGSISGLVTIEGKPAPGIAVVAGDNEWTSENKDAPPPKALTDQSGRYQLRNLPAGKYSVTASAPGFVDARKTNEGARRSSITLADGEAVDKVDFPLKRGGVITGRVTDEDGKPVIEEALTLMRFDETGKKKPINCRMPTDDQGNYRCYGLEPGKYIVGAGKDPKKSEVTWNGGFYERLWYPNVKDEESAKEIAVTAGNETTEIDLKLRRRKKGFAVSGRVIEADTGKPVGQISVMSSPVGENGQMNMYYGGYATSADGEFKLLDVSPGKYGALASNWNAPDGLYAEAVMFEVTDSNITDLEIKMLRGVTVAGQASLENNDDPQVLRKLANVEVSASAASEEGKSSFSNNRSSRLDAAGNFQLKGLRPGKLEFTIWTEEKGLRLTRLERGGVLVQETLEVKEGESVTDLKVVLGYGTGTIQGQVKFEGGDIPEDMSFYVEVGRGNGVAANRGGEVDARGRFLIEGLSAGTYEVTVKSQRSKPPWDKPVAKIKPVKQSVDVTNGVAATTTITVNVNDKEVAK